MINEFINWLIENKWKVVLNDVNYDTSCNEVLKKYQHLPDEVIHLLEKCKCVESNDETTWFLCGEDYNYESDDAFKWNEFELISLEAAHDDEEWKKNILDWWNDKLPIILSVRDGYLFYAIDMGNNGVIIKGEEPEFENTVVVADSYYEFIKKVMDKTIEL